jgi:hypothetical protein
MRINANKTYLFAQIRVHSRLQLSLACIRSFFSHAGTGCSNACLRIVPARMLIREFRSVRYWRQTYSDASVSTVLVGISKPKLYFLMGFGRIAVVRGRELDVFAIS